MPEEPSYAEPAGGPSGAGPGGAGGLREIARLAVPAFGALVAQPLFVLVDAAVVGTLGTLPLAGLGAAASLVATVLGLCIFLAYATTSSVARRVGEGRWDAAVAEGVEGMAVGLGLGVLLALLTWLLAEPAVAAFGAGPEVAPYAVTYLRVVALGFPAALVAMAGVGVLRGLQDTRTTLVVTLVAVGTNLVLALVLVLGLGLGVAGSAAATAAAEAVQAVAYLLVVARVARAHGVGLAPSGLGMLATVRTGGPLFVRTVALRAVFLVTAAVAARLGAADLAAWHVSFQVWMLLALAADALAIAGMALLGRYLGAADAEGARHVTARLVRLGVVVGVVLGAVLLVCVPWLPSLFTSDPVVRGLVASALVVVALQQPLAAPVFVLDGVLIGAGDGRWLAGAGAVMLLAFLPAAWAVLANDLGVVALWLALCWFMVVRAVLLGWRARGSAWLRASGSASGPAAGTASALGDAGG